MIMASSSSQLAIPPGQKWYDITTIPNLPPKTMSRDEEVVRRKEAEQLLMQESDMYFHTCLDRGSKKSQLSFVKSVLSSGTLQDKLAAHTLLVQNSPIHNLTSIQTMTELAKSKGKREYEISADYVKELMLGDLLPANRKLKPFSELVRLLHHKEGERERNIFLMVSFFEDRLKACFRDFVQTIQRYSWDPINATKSKSIKLMYELLSGTSEQEQYLLEELCGKLADPVARVVSLTSQLLRNLVTEDHPAMKEVVVKEIERVLFRSEVKERTQYYCLCFLQEVPFLAKVDESVSNRLIDIYLAFFKKCVKSGEVNNRTMKAVMTGVSRALPYSSPSVGPTVVQQHLETLFKMIYLVNTDIGIQVLCLIFQIVSRELSSSKSGVSDLKRKKLKMEGKGRWSNKKSKEKERINTSLTAENKNLDRFYSALYRFLLKPDVFESTSRPGMLFNLLFRSLSSDQGGRERGCSFVKRLLQVSCTCGPQVSTSILYLISHILIKDRTTFVFTDNHNADDDAGEASKTDYEMSARNPLFAHPDKGWEMYLLTKHYHPTVNLFASRMKANPLDKLEYDGDPLQDFSLTHFLDRFVHRNPKKLRPEVLKVKQTAVFGRQSHPSRELENMEIMQRDADKVPVQERFIHQFLKSRGHIRQNKNKEDIESISSNEFENYMDRFEHDFEDDGFELKREFEGVKFNSKRKHDDEESNNDDDNDDLFDDPDSDEEPDFEGDMDMEFDDEHDLVHDSQSDSYDDEEDESNPPSVKLLPKKKIMRGNPPVVKSLTGMSKLKAGKKKKHQEKRKKKVNPGRKSVGRKKKGKRKER